MLETGLVLGATAGHLGVPLTDLVAWALLVAFLAAPAPLVSAKNTIIEIGGAKLRPAVARCRLDKAPADVAIVPAATRLSVNDQWQKMTRLVSESTERAMAVAREHQSVRRELDSLDMTLEDLRRDLASVMSSALPAAARQPILVPIATGRTLYARAA